MAASATPQRSAQELHDAILAHNEAMKEVSLTLIKGGIEDLSDDVLNAMILLCRAMANLVENLEPIEEAVEAVG